MSRDVLAWYIKEHLLKVRQTPVSINDPPKKPTTKDKIKPRSFQKVRPNNRQPKVTGFKYFVMPFAIENCKFQRVLLHLEEYGDHLARNEWQVQERSTPNIPRMQR